MRTSRFLALGLILSVFGGQLGCAYALRPFPATAKKMEMSFAGGDSVAVDDTAYRLSPGAQIRDSRNFIVLPSHIHGEYKVRAVMDNNGQVHRVWLLTPEEAAVADPKQ
ncbi:hypothetical protein [Azoarcus sp. TTM-91]|uniref:hypothetical protein n=1 Tax=Azoarcus sp. TTM-91 TaxID=2691581 RepID=UPI002006EF97|nr:hypothetical protein [Azoarcus sp. TTM-91]